MFHAVVVGVDQYEDERIPPLSCAANDARTVAALLEQSLAVDERRVCLLVDQAATHRNVAIAVDDVSRAVAADDIVLIYFAGHGAPERAGSRQKRGCYLLTHDTDYAHIYATAIGMESDVPAWFQRLEAARLVVITLDCCFSGSAGGRTLMGPLLRAANGLESLLPKPVSLRGLDLGRGRVILCASDDNQVAREDKDSGHGIFTRHLLDALTRERGGASTILLTELYDEIESAVRIDTGGAQEPLITLIPNKRAALPCLAGQVQRIPSPIGESFST